MVDYTARTRRSMPKGLARYLFTRPIINKFAVSVLKRLPAGELRSRFPVVAGTADLVLDGGAQVILCGTDRCQVASEVFWNGGRLRNPADRLALHAAVRLSAGADLFLDIGAYTGLFALAVARRHPETIAYAYEIVPENFQLLWTNVLANDLVGRVVPQLTGVGAQAGSLRIPRSFGLGLLASSVALDAISKDGVTVPIACVDELHGDYCGRAVMKIDVEGFEWPVLQGGAAFIGRNRPDIICEVLRRAPDVPQLQSFLRERGYGCYRFTASGLAAGDTIVPVKGERDWLFTPRSSDELGALGLPVAAC